MLKKRNRKIIAAIIIVLSTLLFVLAIYIKNYYDKDIVYQVIYYLNNGLANGSKELIYIGIKDSAILFCLVSLILVFPILSSKTHITFLNIRVFNKEKNIQIFPIKIINKSPISYSFIVFSLSLVFTSYYIGIFNYISNSNKTTKIYEEYYVDPSTINISFQEKNNLILIFLESMENSFASKANGGLFEQSIIPGLEKIAIENINFSNNISLIGGSQTTIGSNWTVASMVANTSGIPLSVYGINGNDLGKNKKFLPGAFSLGDVLEKEGYNQTLLLGSDAEFGGRKQYFQQHGNYFIYDSPYAIKIGDVSEDNYNLWGFEDDLLFELAKKELSILSTKNKPFNLTMLTVDSHNPGWDNNNCKINISNIILKATSCQSLYVAEFIDWLMKQPYYNNTTIVIIGDHLLMDFSTIGQNIPENYNRTVYNAIINSKVLPSKTNGRIFTAYDLYPTILAAMGAKIENNQLGFGINLFSDNKTLSEELGIKRIAKEPFYKSDYYFNKIYLGKKQ